MDPKFGFKQWQVRGQMISYTTAKKKSILKQTEQLNKELINIEHSHKQSPTEENLKKLNAVRTTLNLVQTEHIKKLMSLPDSNIMCTVINPADSLPINLKKECEDSTIKYIRNVTGQMNYDIQSINSSFLDFYTKLYISDNPVEIEIHTFLEKVLLPSISDTDKERLSALFTPDEVLQVINSMPSGKTPGLDRYPVEFYKAFWPQICPSLCPCL